jgi:hypothetical protein
LALKGIASSHKPSNVFGGGASGELHGTLKRKRGVSSYLSAVLTPVQKSAFLSRNLFLDIISYNQLGKLEC